MTGTEFADYVKRKFKRSDKDTELYEATTDTIALMRTKFGFDEVKEEAYVAGISTLGEYQIALPSDFGRIIGQVSIVDTASDQYYDPLRKISKEEYDRRFADRSLSSVGNVNTSVPRFFCIFAGQLYLGPVPDLITYRYQINYTTVDSSDVTSSTDPVPFTSELRDRNVLRNGVMFELHDGLENFEEASYYKSLFLDGLSDLVRLENTNKNDQAGVQYNGC